MARSTRERIIDEALRLFAERGYAATSVAEIEAAAGLSPGAGGLYRHFNSKYEVLSSAVHHRATRTRVHIDESLAKANSPDIPLEERLLLVCQAGLTIVHEERELTRVFFRDLSQFPELVAVVRRSLLGPMYESISHWFATQPEYAGSDADWNAATTLLVSSVLNYHLLGETMGEPPNDTDPTRFAGAYARLGLGLLPRPSTPAG